MVHLIFVTKYRKKIVLGDFRDAVKQYLFDTCVKNHWYVKRMETDQDHVYILLQYNPTDSITHIVSILKQHSTYLSWQQHSALLKQHYWKKHVDLCQYFEHKKLKGYADFFNSSSSFCCGVI